MGSCPKDIGSNPIHAFITLYICIKIKKEGYSRIGKITDFDSVDIGSNPITPIFILFILSFVSYFYLYILISTNFNFFLFYFFLNLFKKKILRRKIKERGIIGRKIRERGKRIIKKKLLIFFVKYFILFIRLLSFILAMSDCVQ